MPTNFPIYLRTDNAYGIRQRSILAPFDGTLRLGWVFKGEPQQTDEGRENCRAHLKVIVNGTTLFERHDTSNFHSFDFGGSVSVQASEGVQYDIVMDRTGTGFIRDTVEIDFEIQFNP